MQPLALAGREIVSGKKAAKLSDEINARRAM